MIKDPPLLTIRRDFERPSRDLIAELAGTDPEHGFGLWSDGAFFRMQA